MRTRPTLIDRFQDQVFSAVAGNALLYNACWEDPAVDREALRLGPSDRVLVITSAGCNALDYALAGAGRVHAVDLNPRQTALLELKLAGIRRLGFDEFFACFGRGYTADFPELYRELLRPDLPPAARRFWDRRQHWFTTPERSFYFRGLSGLAARLVNSWIGRDARLRAAVDDLLAAESIAEQRDAYARMAPLLWTRGLQWVLRRQAAMNLLGVPRAQRRELEASHPGGAPGFIRAAVESVCTDLPLRDNYFWLVYLRGAYTRTCCPEYLKRANFYALKHGLAARISAHTDSVTGFLRRTDERFTRFVLLDHQDWLGQRPHLLAEEWEAILAAAAPGARAIFRSASPRPGWLETVRVERDGRPVPLGELLRFDAALAARLHTLDRVRTYASFHIADLAA